MLPIYIVCTIPFFKYSCYVLGVILKISDDQTRYFYHWSPNPIRGKFQNLISEQKEK